MRIILVSCIIFLTACSSHKHWTDIYTYNGLDTPVTSKDASQDSDGDGVSNKYDRCPNTRKGIEVTVKGCPKDTDGDGVADYKDKELITPTYCQPSDSNGVGSCKK